MLLWYIPGVKGGERDNRSVQVSILSGVTSHRHECYCTDCSGKTFNVIQLAPVNLIFGLFSFMLSN